VKRKAPDRKFATPHQPGPPASISQAPVPGIQAPASSIHAIEERFGPIVAAVDRVARGDEPPTVRLEGAMEIIFGAYGQSDPDFSEMLLTGWMRARHDKHHRLALAWQREQLRLSLEEILQAGVTAGAFRKDMVTGAVAAVMLGAAEGCLLQSATQGGAVPPGELVRALMNLALSGA
jgi:BetI-type transcriptional repressor, C-terminal